MPDRFPPGTEAVWSRDGAMYRVRVGGKCPGFGRHVTLLEQLSLTAAKRNGRELQPGHTVGAYERELSKERHG